MHPNFRNDALAPTGLKVRQFDHAKPTVLISLLMFGAVFAVEMPEAKFSRELIP
jgi:hypothetical protein